MQLHLHFEESLVFVILDVLYIFMYSKGISYIIIPKTYRPTGGIRGICPEFDSTAPPRPGLGDSCDWIRHNGLGGTLIPSHDLLLPLEALLDHYHFWNGKKQLEIFCMWKGIYFQTRLVYLLVRIEHDHMQSNS